MDDGARPPLRLLPLFAIALGGLALLFHPNLFLNDEVAQVASLDSLAHGNLELGLPPEGFAPFLQGVYRHAGIPLPGAGHYALSGSTMLNVLALPVLFALKGVAAIAGVRGALAIAPAALATWGAWSLLRLLPRQPRLRAPWLIMPAAAFVPFLPAPALPAEPYLEIAATHLVSMAATAMAAAFLFDLLRRPVGQARALVAAGGYLLATPALFWGLDAKYHALSISLAAVAAWCYADGGRTGPLRTFLAFAVVGLAWWNKPGLGALLGAAFFLLALPALRLGVRPALERAGAAVAGGLVGLAPDLMFRLAAFEEATRTVTAAVASPGGAAGGAGASAGGVGGVGNAALGAVTGHTFSNSLFSSFWAAADAIAQALVWTRWQDVGAALSMLCVAPAFAVAVAALARPALREGLPRSLVWMAGLYGALLLLLVGKQFLAVGAGFDMRHATTLWPFVTILCAPALAGALRRHGWRWVRGVAAMAGLLVAATLAANLAAHLAGHYLTSHGSPFDETALFRWGGLAVGVATLVAFLAPASPALRDRLLGLAVSFGLGVQALLLLDMSNPVGDAPFSAWPVEGLSQVVRWAFSLR